MKDNTKQVEKVFDQKGRQMKIDEVLKLLQEPIKHLVWMARRYAEGRLSYAPTLFNDSYDRIKKFIDIDEDNDPDNRTDEYRPIKNFPYATRGNDKPILRDWATLRERERIEDKLDELFPKGKSKERGAALILFAEVMRILAEKEKTYTHQEIKEFLEKYGEETLLNWLKINDNSIQPTTGA